MMKKEEIIIQQKEIDLIFQQPKLIKFNSLAAVWRKKQFNQPAPAWLEMILPILNTNEIPIEQLRFHAQFRPARREGLIPSISFLAMYKNRRLFALDQGQNLAHNNTYLDTEPPCEPRIYGCHYHLLQEKYNQETGYLLDEMLKDETDFYCLAEYFCKKFNLTSIGTIPHPIDSQTGQMELFL